MLGFLDYLSFAVSLIGVVLILFFAYFGSKWIAGKMSTGMIGKNIKVIDRTALSPDKSLIIVQVSNKYMMLGVSPQRIEKICDLSKEDIAAPTDNMPQSSFKGILQSSLASFNILGANRDKNMESEEIDKSGS
ncbi:MAG TPA: flagellar biosynthetic protein FliO [Ruminococcaceae bacterium]|nr:flagellar biosynthetic protein FliO [Oscillospiraceae bacterium]